MADDVSDIVATVLPLASQPPAVTRIGTDAMSAVMLELAQGQAARGITGISRAQASQSFSEIAARAVLRLVPAKCSKLVDLVSKIQTCTAEGGIFETDAAIDKLVDLPFNEEAFWET